MSLNKIGEIFCKLLSGNLSILGKIFVSISILWIVTIGYLIWWNAIINPIKGNSFNWEEWIWFGIIPAVVPYLFYFVWKKRE